MNGKKIMGIILLSSVMMVGCTGKRPKDLGLKDGLLTPCPDKPNCVISYKNDSDHYIEPLVYQSSKDKAFEKIKQILDSEKRVVLIEETEHYIRAEFTTAVFRFVDDVEFYFPQEQLIHVRSASRLGTSDLGLNRKRIEIIRSRFNSEAVE